MEAINESNGVPVYRESEYLTLVRDFHRHTKNNWNEIPVVPYMDRLELRSHLIIEEAREFEVAAKTQDLVGMADALVDLLYVTFGSVGELGMGSIIAELFEEVHRSNMSKLCKTEEIAKATVKWYAEGIDVDKCEANYQYSNGMYIVYRVSDGKTLKSKDYSPANIGGILEAHYESLKRKGYKRLLQK